MQVRQILEVKGSALYTIASDKTLAEAVAIMNEQDIGSVVCFDHGRLGVGRQ